jgi:hypothetical protein
MTVISKLQKLSPRFRSTLILVIVALPLGYAVGRGLARLKHRGGWSPEALGWSDVLIGAIALTLLLVGAVTLAVSASRRVLGQRIDPEGGRLATSAQSRFYAQQGLVLILSGVMLAAPVVAGVVFQPLSPLLAAAVMTGIVALFLVQTASNLALWFGGDELMRKAIAETAALSFAILQGALFLWAAGEKLGLLKALSLWDAVGVMMAAYLAVTTLVTWRRGLAG